MSAAFIRTLALSAFLAGFMTASRAAPITEPAQSGQKIVLQLANGDRLSGELIWRADGKVRFRSPILGDLTLAETDAAILSLPEALDPAAAAHATSPRATPPPPAPQADRSAATASTPPPAKPAAAQAAAPAKERWKGKVELGSVQQAGRTDSLSYNVRGEAEKSAGRHALRGTGRILYAEQNGRPGADRQDAALRWRYQLSKRTFAQAQSTYYSDEIVQIQTNLEQNLGLGYRVVDQPRQVMNLGGGLTAQYREWDAGTNGWAPYAELFQDYSLRINDRISFNQDVVVQYSPSDRAFNIPNRHSPGTVDPEEQNYKVRLNGTLQGKVTEHISVNLRFEYELDNAIQIDNARETQRLTSSIGYAF